MTFSIAISLFLLAALVVSGILFSLAARLLLGEWPIAWRAVAAYFVCIIVSLAAHAAGAWGTAELGADWPIWMASIASLGLMLAAVAMILPATVPQALGIAVVHAALAIAVLLPAAWVFKDQVYDVYVQPAATLAPSLLGHHRIHRCGNCGLSFPVGYREAEQREPDITVVCTNCDEEEPLDPATPLLDGDRIAVDHGGYPERWRLMAFHPPDAPEAVHVARVVCFPAEHVEIHAGDVFINGRRWPRMSHEFLEMWAPVADSRYRGQEKHEQRHVWEPQGESSAWKAAELGWRCEAKEEESELRLSGVVDDTYSYLPRLASEPEFAAIPVADVRIDCELESLTGEGVVALRWKGLGRTLTAEFTAGGAVSQEITKEAIQVRQPIGGGQQTISLAVRDGRVCVLVDGASKWDAEFLPANLGEARQVKSAREAPPILSIVAKNCSVAVGHIRVSRDVYYLSKDDEAARGLEIETSMGMKDGEYFFVGDNSRISKDSRFYGPVPRSALLGRVRAVYWPPARWREWE